MSDDLFAKARELHAAFQAEIDKLVQQRDAFDRRIRLLNAQAENVGSFINAIRAEDSVSHTEAVDKPVAQSNAATADSAPRAPRTGPRPTDNSSKEEVAKAAKEIVEAAGQPVPRDLLLKILTHDRGLKIEGARPLTVLSTMMWRTRDESGLIHLRGYGYWFEERPYAPADHDPFNKGYWLDRSEVDETDAADD